MCEFFPKEVERKISEGEGRSAERARTEQRTFQRLFLPFSVACFFLFSLALSFLLDYSLYILFQLLPPILDVPLTSTFFFSCPLHLENSFFDFSFQLLSFIPPTPTFFFSCPFHPLNSLTLLVQVFFLFFVFCFVFCFVFFCCHAITKCSLFGLFWGEGEGSETLTFEFESKY